MIATPARARRRSAGISGTPGDSTIRSAPVKIGSGWPPSASSTPAGSAASAAPRSPAPRLSVTVTRAPRAAHSRAAATPERPSPTTSTRLALQIDRHRTLSVSNSPRIAQANETIQKRTTIRDSGQPFFSKWWWIGAIRKTRCPVRLK